jgi:hypothetical protein
MKFSPTKKGPKGREHTKVLQYLRVSTGASWISTLAMTFTGTDVRLWACSLVATAVSSLALVQSQFINPRLDGAYVSMAKAWMGRGLTPPVGLPALKDVSQRAAVPGPPRRGRHAVGQAVARDKAVPGPRGLS